MPTDTRDSLTTRIKKFALSEGADLAGIAPVADFQELEFYPDWLDKGYAGEMEYLKRQLPKRLDPRKILPEAQSVVVIGIIYHTDHELSIDNNDKERGWISRYAWGDDYHKTIEKLLKRIHSFIKEDVGEQYQGRYYVDTGPVLDRVFAKYAGLGWFGKNTNLINQEKGSWFFIGEIITNLVLEIDAPPPDRCGTCRRCLDACPTDAFPEPYVVDSNRCISYLTIEHRGIIPEEMRDGIGNHLFGCDICQDVCPWNRKAHMTTNPAFMPRQSSVGPELMPFSSLDEEAFRERFQKSPVKRTKWVGFMRNILIVMGNSGSHSYMAVVEKFINHSDTTLAETAQWALRKLVEANEHK